MIRRELAVAVLVFIHLPLFASSWARSYDTVDAARAMVRTRDQGFVIADGSTLTRADANGKVLWSTTISAEGTIAFAAQGPGDDLYTGGMILKSDHIDGWIVRLNGDGKVVWSRHYGDGASDVAFRAAAGMAEGDVAVCGSADHNGVVMRVAADGSIKWQSRFDVSEKSWLTSIAASRDGGVIVGGRGGPAWLIAKLNGRGTMQWHRTIGSRRGYAYAVIETADGIVAGGTGALVVKLANDGHTLWQHRITSDAEDAAYDVVELANRNLLVTSTSGRQMMLVMTFAPSGEVVWQRMHGAGDDIGTSDLNGRNALATSDGGALVAATGKRLRVLRFDGDGHIDGGCAMTADVTLPIAPASDSFAPIDALLLPAKLTVADAPLEPETLKHHDETFCDPERQRILEAAVAAKRPHVAATVASFEAALDEKETFRNDVAAMVIAKRFDDLDAMAAKLRTSHAMFQTFEAKLEIFYQSVASPSIDAAIGAEEHIARMNEWRMAKPDSPTAVVALATTLTKQASLARGNGFAGTVTERGAEQYRQYLERAAKVLDDGKAIAASDPHYWVERIDVEQGNGLSILKQAGNVGDWYPMLYFAAMAYALPQWGGTPQEYMAITEEAVRHTRAVYGDGMYARFAWKLMQLAVGGPEGDRLKTYGFSWPRIRAAYQSLIERYPGHIPNYHELAHFAYWNGDRELARALFVRPELAWSRGAQRSWSDREDYDTARAWADEKPKAIAGENSQSSLGNDPSKWPLMVERRSDLGSGFLIRSKAGVSMISAANGELLMTPVPAPAKTAVVLEPRMTPVEMRDVVYVAGAGTPQPVFEGFVAGFSNSLIFVDSPRELDWKAYYGCPVLDESGKVVAVVTSSGRPGPYEHDVGFATLLAPAVKATGGPASLLRLPDSIAAPPPRPH